MAYYFQGIERFQFFGLNPNETACVIIYLLCVLWIVEKSNKNIKLLFLSWAVEIILLYFLVRTMSRGGVVAVVIVATMSGLVCRRGIVAGKSISENRLLKWGNHLPPFNKGWKLSSLCKIVPYARNLNRRNLLNGIMACPIWRVLLVMLYPGIWGRMSPAYMTGDASVGNRLTLWRGAVKLYSGAIWEGWGWANTGHGYVNWMQSNSDKTEYNGLVNSFLQIGVAFGGVVLALVMAFLILGLFHSHALTQTKHHMIGSLCLMWTATWIISSFFSSMMRSSLLVVPVAISIPLSLILLKPKFKHILMSLGFAAACSLGLYITGLILTDNSQLKIVKTNGVIHICNAMGSADKNCVFYADACALGEKYGKEVRRFIETKNISNCYVIDNVKIAPTSKPSMAAKTVFVLSGDAVSAVDIDKIQSNTILLYPLSEAMPPVKTENIKQIIFPEIDPLKYIFLWQNQSFWTPKIQLIPYDKPFETTWADYITDI